jgi:Arm DNA-binding domain
MRARRLTDLMCERVKPLSGGRAAHFDAVRTALGLRVSTNGSKAWFLFYRLNGRQRPYTVGPYPQSGTLARAMSRARFARRTAATGMARAEFSNSCRGQGGQPHERHHPQCGVVYNQLRRAALEAWGRYVSNLVVATPASIIAPAPR